MAQKGVTLQAAMNAAAALVKQAFSEFSEAERLITSLRPSQEIGPKTTSPWNIVSFLYGSVVLKPSSGWDEAAYNDVKLYIQGLKDCIVGALNWSYEAELFFGDKGEEVRTFGWVFLRPKSNIKSWCVYVVLYHSAYLTTPQSPVIDMHTLVHSNHNRCDWSRPSTAVDEITQMWQCRDGTLQS